MPTSTRTTGAAPGATLKEKMAARRRAALSQAPTVPAADSVPLPASSAAPAPVASAAAVAEPSAAPVAQTQPQGPAFSPPPPPAPAPVATQAAPPSLPGPAVNVPAHVEAELAGMAQAPVEAPPTNGDLPIKVLLVDCAPLQGDILSVINLSTLMHRLAEPAELGELIDGLKLPDNAAVTMSMRTPEGQLAFDALADRSELVIRGF
jgi:hypothetical protein